MQMQAQNSFRLTMMLAAAISSAIPGTAGAQDSAALQQQQIDRAALAAIAGANAQIAASNAATTKAIVEPLSSLAGTGKRDLVGDAGKIEVALLGSTGLVALADLIAEDAKPFGKLIVLSDDETLNLAAAWQFDAEQKLLERRFSRAQTAATEVCQQQTDDGEMFKTAALPAVFAAVGAIGSLLRSDVTVTGAAYDPASRIVASLVARKLASEAVTPAGLLSPDHSTTDAVLAALDSSLGDTMNAVVECSRKAQDKRTPSETALLADVAATGAALTAFRSRLFTPDATGRFPMLDVLLGKTIATHKVLRVRIEDAGGSVVATKNLLTAFGAPALSVTAGIVASYTVTNPATGEMSGSGLYNCRSQARMLHSVHRDDRKASVCTRVGVSPPPE
jgi:hypothetical protein